MLREVPQGRPGDRAVGEVAQPRLAAVEEALLQHAPRGEARLRADVGADVRQREADSLAREVPLPARILRELRVDPLRRDARIDEPDVVVRLAREAVVDVPRRHPCICRGPARDGRVEGGLAGELRQERRLRLARARAAEDHDVRAALELPDQIELDRPVRLDRRRQQSRAGDRERIDEHVHQQCGHEQRQARPHGRQREPPVTDRLHACHTRLERSLQLLRLGAGAAAEDPRCRERFDPLSNRRHAVPPSGARALRCQLRQNSQHPYSRPAGRFSKTAHEW